MRILLNMPSQYCGKPSGVARMGFLLLRHLLEVTDHSFVLRSNWRRDMLPRALRVERIEVVEISRPRILVLDVIWQIATMPFFCRKHNIDVVLNVDPYGSPAGGSARITIVHDLYYRTIPEQIGSRAVFTNNIILSLVLKGSTKIVCVSEATRRDVSAHYPSVAGRCVTIHSDSTMRPEASGDDRPALITGRFVLAVGNATRNKNFAALGRAFAVLHEHDSSLKLVHVGFDEENELAMAIPGGEARKALVRLSKIDDAALTSLYKMAACLCVPSLYEGFCLPIVEAQQFGCPVVCSDQSCLPEIAGDGALFFDPSDPSAIASAIKCVLYDERLRDDLRARGALNQKRFSWKKTALSYAALFRAVI